MRCNWFFLCLKQTKICAVIGSFSVRILQWNRFHGNGPTHILFSWSKANIFEIYNQTADKDEYCNFFFFSKTIKRSWKDWKFNVKDFYRLMKKTNILRVSFIILNICKLLMQKLKHTVHFTISQTKSHIINHLLTEYCMGPSVSTLGLHCHGIRVNKFKLYFNWSSL